MRNHRLALALLVVLAPSLSLQAHINTQRVAVSAAVVGFIGFAITVPLLVYYRTDQFKEGSWCGLTGSSACCVMNSDGSVNYANCTSPLSTPPLICPTETAGECFSSGNWRSPSDYYPNWQSQTVLAVAAGVSIALVGIGTIVAIYIQCQKPKVAAPLHVAALPPPPPPGTEALLPQPSPSAPAPILCSKCVTRPLDTRLDPCGHTFCGACVQPLDRCPNCGDTILQKQPVVL